MIGVVRAATVIVTVSFDDLTRPLCEEIDELVADRRGSDARLSVRTRVTATNALIGWGTGFVTAAIAVRFQTHAGQLGSAAVASLVFGVLFAVLIANPVGVRPILRPLDDLLQGTKRVAAGQFTHRVTRTSDDEFGDLIASFNQMQQGLLERERLHSAFGSYVDPALARRLLSQSHDLFAGEEVTVTVFFADVRDFTPYAERATPRETVERLNALFELVVVALREHHGHANKFLGDGVLAVFGAPEVSDQHADDAIAAAQAIQDKVRSTFGDSLRVGIGINTGQVIAGTVGGGGKLEFTLIGDAVNVAARVEQMTKTTGDPILLTQATLDAATRVVPPVVARGVHELKGKAAATTLYALT
jgi:class 3 adenylate cyclase